MWCLLNQSYISQSPGDSRKDLLQQLHWLITWRRDRGSERDLRSVKERRKLNQKEQEQIKV